MLRGHPRSDAVTLVRAPHKPLGAGSFAVRERRVWEGRTFAGAGFAAFSFACGSIAASAGLSAGVPSSPEAPLATGAGAGEGSGTGSATSAGAASGEAAGGCGRGRIQKRAPAATRVAVPNNSAILRDRGRRSTDRRSVLA